MKPTKLPLPLAALATPPLPNDPGNEVIPVKNLPSPAGGPTLTVAVSSINVFGQASRSNECVNAARFSEPLPLATTLPPTSCSVIV